MDAGAAVFLDRSRPEAERLRAVEGIAVVNRQVHLRGAAAVVMDAQEPVAVRVRALQLGGRLAASDTLFARWLLGAAADRTMPLELRREMSQLFQALMFTSAAKDLLHEELHRPLRDLARDPDLGVSRPALEVMAAEGDQANCGCSRTA